ncbi:PREDICTED: protein DETOXIFICATION 27-like isoform X1 [Ipomoea nil]|uniref:protein DETOXIFICATION 27-like isoform X1 n=1 Tax=Ipomoea nil TaxID=35883 RepID=UPI000901C219|nr:PREDICTED: protein DETOXIFICATION 27-like isoform X1 [Ipomoea nil]
MKYEPLLLPTTSSVQEEEEEGNLVKQTWAESKKIWHVAGPTIFSRLAMFSLTVITQSFAGHLGDRDLAAITLVTTLLIGITFGFLLGMASALETLCGQAYGAKQYHMLGVYLQRSWIVLSLGAIVMLPLFIFASPIVKLLGQPDDVAELTGKVAIWLIPMHLSFPLQFSFMRFLQCQLKTWVIAWICGGVLVLHVVLSWVFIYILEVGIVGTALILDVSWWTSVLGLVAYSLFGGCPHSWTGFSKQGFLGLWEFFKLSLASGIMLSLENFYFRILIIVSGYIKNAEVAIDALSVCVTIIGWESMIPLGLFAATGVRVANELGAGNGKGAKLATKVSLLNSIAIGILFWLIIIVFPDKLAMIFTSNTSVIQMVRELAFLLGTTILINCIQPILSGVAVGSGWQALVAYVNIGSYYLVGIPFALTLGWFFHFGLKGIWIGMICGTVVQTLILTILTLKQGWERGKTL